MARIITLAVLLLALSFRGLCEEPNAEKTTATKMTARSYRVPPGFFTIADPSNKDGTRKPNPGFSYNPGSQREIDATEWLRQAGMQFPSGSMAIYDRVESALIVVNTPENLELVETIVGGCRSGFALMVQAEFSAVECSLTSTADTLSLDRLSYSDLTQLAGNSMKQVNGASLLGKSGQRCTMEHIVKSPAVKCSGSSVPYSEFATKFAEDEFGTKVELEPTIGPDMISMDLNTVYRLRYKAGNQIVYLEFQTALLAWDNYPLVLHVSPLPDQKGKFVAIILRAQIVKCGGWKFPTAHTDAKAEQK